MKDFSDGLRDQTLPNDLDFTSSMSGGGKLSTVGGNFAVGGLSYLNTYEWLNNINEFLKFSINSIKNSDYYKKKAN